MSDETKAELAEVQAAIDAAAKHVAENSAPVPLSAELLPQAVEEQKRHAIGFYSPQGYVVPKSNPKAHPLKVVDVDAASEHLRLEGHAGGQWVNAHDWSPTHGPVHTVPEPEPEGVATGSEEDPAVVESRKGHSGFFDEYGELPTLEEYTAAGYKAEGYPAFMLARTAGGPSEAAAKAIFGVDPALAGEATPEEKSPHPPPPEPEAQAPADAPEPPKP